MEKQVCWMVWGLESVSFWLTKKQAKAEANWQMAQGAAEVIITKAKIHRVLSNGSAVERRFPVPRVLRFSQEETG